MILKLKCKYNKQTDEYIIDTPRMMITRFKFPTKQPSDNIPIIKKILYISLAIVMIIAMISYKLGIEIGIENLTMIWVFSIFISSVLTNPNRI